VSEHSYKLFNFKDIEKLSITTESAKGSITDVGYKFLKYYIKNPGVSIYRMCNDNSFLQAKYPKKYTTKVVKHLLELNLIETESKQQGYRCRLSTAGIFFLISNDNNDNNRLRLPITWDLLKILLNNYNDNILFEFLIDPYIEYETLGKIDDSLVFDRLLSYLRDCCKTINFTAYAINHTYIQKNGYVTNPLFIWQNIPKEDFDTQSLRDFLKTKFQWDWINKATIKRTDDVIEISYSQYHALIKMNENQTKAELVVRGKQTYEFNARSLTDKTAIDTDEFVIEGLRPFKITVSEYHVLQFLIFQQTRLLEFISSLFLIYGSRSPAIEVLSKDEKFLRSLKKMKKHFDKVYGSLI
jgi:hypothetical protein